MVKESIALVKEEVCLEVISESGYWGLVSPSKSEGMKVSSSKYDTLMSGVIHT